uniref:Uncharacterized protein n=1 Tax=Sphaerodactylus townsendi TaxID=933632 RepID=A0ACB8EKU9_9SAUR
MFAIYVLLLLFLRCPASDENIILQEPILITAEEGESVNITCHLNHSNMVGLYLRRKFVNDVEVLYISGHGKRKIVSPEYKGRIEYFEQQNTVTIMMQQLQKNDSGNYTCEGTILTNQEPKIMEGHGTVLAVIGKKLTTCSSSSWMVYGLAIETLILAIALGFFILSRVDAKKYCQKQKGREEQNMVYEDMTYGLSHNTVANHYQC